MCQSSICFQTSTNNRLCRRKLLFDCRTPTLQQHGTIWLYHLPEPRQVTIRSLKNNTWSTHAELLHDARLIRNASQCSIATHEVRTLPKLQGTAQANLETSHIYIPDKINVVANHEIPLLEQISPGAVAQLHEIRSKTMVSSPSLDVHSIFHIQQASLRE